jgi:hypothetical protein
MDVKQVFPIQSHTSDITCSDIGQFKNIPVTDDHGFEKSRFIKSVPGIWRVTVWATSGE